MANSEEDKSDTDQIFIQKNKNKTKTANNIIFLCVHKTRRQLDLFWQDYLTRWTSSSSSM